MNSDDDGTKKISAADDENTNSPHLSKLTDQQDRGNQVADQHRRLVGGDEGRRDRPAIACVRRSERQTNNRSKHYPHRETPIPSPGWKEKYPAAQRPTDDGLRVSRSRPPVSLFLKCLRIALLACVHSSEPPGFVFRAGSGRPHSVTSTARANSIAENSSSN